VVVVVVRVARPDGPFGIRRGTLNRWVGICQVFGLFVVGVRVATAGVDAYVARALEGSPLVCQVVSEQQGRCSSSSRRVGAPFVLCPDSAQRGWCVCVCILRVRQSYAISCCAAGNAAGALLGGWQQPSAAVSAFHARSAVGPGMPAFPCVFLPGHSPLTLAFV
jgi:hypothetical protein